MGKIDYPRRFWWAISIPIIALLVGGIYFRQSVHKRHKLRLARLRKKMLIYATHKKEETGDIEGKEEFSEYVLATRV